MSCGATWAIRSLRGGARALQELHEGHHLFIALDRAADHRALHDGIVGGEHRLDLGRIDVEAGADDHLLGAADDVETIALEAREIAGIEPAVGIDRFGGEVGRAVIAAHHVGPADMQFADLAVCDDLAVAPDDFGFEARQKRADRLILARRFRTDARKLPGEHSVMP